MRIVYVDIDSLRADHLGCYGYSRDTTPAIDAIAADGVLLTGCYASDAPCLPARSAFFGGRFGIKTELVNHGGTYADPRREGPLRGFRRASQADAFAEQFRNVGWRTASLSAFPHRHSAPHIWDGFEEMRDPGGDGYGHADDVFALARSWLCRNADADSWFLHVNFWDPHTPYDVPTSYGQPFAGVAAPAWVTSEVIERHRELHGPAGALRPRGLVSHYEWSRGPAEIVDEQSWRDWIDGYDTGIRYVDEFVGKLADELPEGTAIIVSADHGESQGELGIYGDHQTADEPTCHVPVVIRWPGVTTPHAGSRLSGLVYAVDVAATILELAGLEVPNGWDGRSFAPGLRAGHIPGRAALVVQQGAWSCQRSARWDDWLLVHTLHTGLKRFPSLMLFDLHSDPHEQHDLASGEPEVALAGLGLIDEFVTEHLYESGRPDPLESVIADGGPFHANVARPSVVEALAQAGRAADARRAAADTGRPERWMSV